MVEVDVVVEDVLSGDDDSVDVIEDEESEPDDVQLEEEEVVRHGDDECAPADGSSALINSVVPEPEVGMCFRDMLAVDSFYKSYAKQQGFGVTKAQGSYAIIDGKKQLTRRTWRCDCWGSPFVKDNRKASWRAKNPNAVDPSEKEIYNPKKRLTKKCFCNAQIYATRASCGNWFIRKVILEHDNHQPTPSQASLVKEYRMEHVTGSVRRRFKNDSEAGLTVSQTHSSMAIERGGYENMPFTEKDMRHVNDEARKLKKQGGDFNALIAYFDKMHKQNSKFFHTHRVDSKGYLKDIMWVDARSRAAYAEFSDVVCFDTTYKTNQYMLPFANFVGVNHHGQSILFGCALISNEDSETFNWLFSKWLYCMDGRQPGGILTDQAAAMRKPLEEVMPYSKHRWCIWHILRKLPHKLGRLKRYEEFSEVFLEVVYNSLNKEEFEWSWGEVLREYKLQNNEWLSNLFEERHMWVPCFMNDHFWAGMRSNQRVESMNSYFDQFVSRHTMMCEFGERYVAAIEKRIKDEKEADEKEGKFYRYFATGYGVEALFRKLYTSNKFKIVKRECERVTYCMIGEVREVSPAVIELNMEDRVWVLRGKKSEWILTKRRTNYCVSFNRETKFAECNCKMFQTDGIMCRHLIRVYDKLHIEDIPEEYILRRWRKDIIREHTSVRVAYHDLSRTDEVKRFDRLVVAFEALADLASRSERATVIFLNALQAIGVDIKKCLDEDEVIDPSNSEAESNHASASEAVDGAISVKDPPILKKRGRPPSRLKGRSDIGWKPSQQGAVESKKSKKRKRKATSVEIEDSDQDSDQETVDVDCPNFQFGLGEEQPAINVQEQMVHVSLLPQSQIFSGNDQSLSFGSLLACMENGKTAAHPQNLAGGHS